MRHRFGNYQVFGWSRLAPVVLKKNPRLEGEFDWIRNSWKKPKRTPD
jgi:hypothetical protein